MTYTQYLHDCIERLGPVYDAGEARWLMRIILEHLNGWSQTDMLLNGDKEVASTTQHDTETIIARLLTHEPIQYILGETYWHGLTLNVTPDVLIPREETSELVDLISDANKQADLNVLDICTGSGCIAIALARTLPFPIVTATDISENALEVAQANAKRCKTKIKFIQEDALQPSVLPERNFDIIISNPPYIAQSEDRLMNKNVLDYEPHIALFVPDDDPLRFYRAISSNARRLIRPGGNLYLEINPLFCRHLCNMLRKDGWSKITSIKDMHGKDRFITATYKIEE